MMAFIHERTDYISREFLHSEFALFKVFDSVSYFLLSPFFFLFRKGEPSFWLRYRQRIADKVARHIQNKYRLRFLYGFFPPDMFWRDYFQVKEFLPKGIVVDIGATIGDYSLVAAKRFGVDKVIAIEADPRSYGYLVKNIEANGLKDKVFPMNVAAWDSDGMAEMKMTDYFVTDLDGHSVILPCVKLDTILDDKPDLVKIDVEGGEMKVLHGSLRILGEHPKLIVEVHSEILRTQVMALVKGFGYKAVREKINSHSPYTSVMYFGAAN